MKKALGGFGKLMVFVIGLLVFVYLVFFLAQGPIQYSGRGVLARDAADWNALLGAVPSMNAYKPWEIDGEGGQKIRGYESLREGQMPALIWIHGRDQNVTDIGHYVGPLADRDFHVFVMEWRGYTVAPGDTSEGNVLADAMAVYDHLMTRSDVASRRIMAGGVETGAGLAMKLATKRDLVGIVAFSIVPDMETALRRKIPLMPLSFVLRDKWDIRSTLPLVSCPVLFVHGTEDSLFPPAELDAMTSKISSNVKVIKIEGASRDQVPTKANKDVWDTIGDFVQRPGR